MYICIHPEGLLISMFTYAWGVCLHPIGNAWDTDWQQCLSALQDPLLLGSILGFSGKHLLSFVPLFSYNAVLPGWRGKTVSRREFGRNDLLWLTVTWSLAAWHCWQFQGKEVAFLKKINIYLLTLWEFHICIWSHIYPHSTLWLLPHPSSISLPLSHSVLDHWLTWSSVGLVQQPQLLRARGCSSPVVSRTHCFGPVLLDFWLWHGA